MNLPDGFPEHGMNMLHGKRYINHVGLCWLADTKKPGWCCEVKDYAERIGDDGMPIYVQIRGRVWDEKTSHEAIGDASMVNTKMTDCLPRIADTRWKNRALRLFVGWSDVTYEEMRADESAPTPTASRAMASSTAKAAVANLVGGGIHCESCDSMLVDKCEMKAVSWDDHVPDKKTGEKGTFTWAGPLFSCTHKKADGEYCNGAIWWASKVPPGPWWYEGGPLEFIAGKQGTSRKSTTPQQRQLPPEQSQPEQEIPF